MPLPSPNDPLAGLLPGTTGQVDFDAAGAAGDAGFASGTGTGQQGIVPHPTFNGGNGGMFQTAILSAWHWLKTPLSTPMAPVSIFMAVGVVLISILAWNLILYHVRIAAEQI